MNKDEFVKEMAAIEHEAHLLMRQAIHMFNSTKDGAIAVKFVVILAETARFVNELRSAIEEV